MKPSDEKLAELARVAKAQAQRVLDKLPLLGPITWLLMQQGQGRATFVGDLEWRVMPALVLDQAKLFMREGMPLAFVSWAMLSDDVAGRYRHFPHRLSPAEWRSGDQPWIIDLIAPFGGVDDVIKDLRATVLAGKVIRQIAPIEQGKLADIIEL